MKDRGEKETRFWGRPWSLLAAAGWVGLVLGLFGVRYLRIIDQGYGLSAKLHSEGLGGVVWRWLGM